MTNRIIFRLYVSKHKSWNKNNYTSQSQANIIVVIRLIRFKTFLYKVYEFERKILFLWLIVDYIVVRVKISFAKLKVDHFFFFIKRKKNESNGNSENNIDDLVWREMLILFHKRIREMVARMKVRHSTIIHHLNGKSKESWQIDSAWNKWKQLCCYFKKNKDKQNPFLLKRVIEERILKYVKYITFRINTEDGIA